MKPKPTIQTKMMFLLICIIPLLTSKTINAQKNDTVKVMSYNLKFAGSSFEPSWDIRKKMQVDLIKKYEPDIIGTQEGLKEQIDYLERHLPEYTVIGEGRKGGDDDEHMAIFFKRDRFRLREMSSFQLSDTPEVLGSGPSFSPRTVTWARLSFINISEGEHGPYPMNYRGHWENTQEFYVYNTHFFTKNTPGHKKAKLNSAKMIMEKIRDLEHFGGWKDERPVFLTGDFNSDPGSDVYRTFVGAENAKCPFLSKECYTFLEDSKKGGKGIDWVLYKGDLKVLSFEILDYNVDGEYPSDHKPTFVKFLFPDN